MVTFPVIQIVQNSLSVNPSGSRHLNGAAFIKAVDTSAGGVLDFSQVNTTGSGAISSTKLCYGRVSNFGDASGIYNMRLYLKNISAFGAGTYRFLEQKNVTFVPNVTLNSAANNMPTVIPTQPNLSGTIQPGWPFGSPWISGTVPHDQAVTQYFWLAIEVGNNVSTGTYGGAGAGSLRYSLIYDFS